MPGLADSIIDPPATPVSNGQVVDAPGSNSDLLVYTDFVTHPTATGGMTYDGAWTNPRPGGYFELAFNFPGPNTYVLSLMYSAWLEGAGYDLLVDRVKVGALNLPVTGDVSTFSTIGMTFPIGSAGVHRIRLTTFDTAVPYSFREGGGNPVGGFITGIGTALPAFGTATHVSAAVPTTVDVKAISDDFRFNMSPRDPPGWGGAHNNAFLEYLFDVEKAGDYKVVFTYSSTTGTDGIQIWPFNGLAVDYNVVTYGKPAAVVDLPATAKGEYKDTAPQTVTLPAGTCKVRFAARYVVYDVKLSGIKITP
jgi:hypothetical protein